MGTSETPTAFSTTTQYVSPFARKIAGAVFAVFWFAMTLPVSSSPPVVKAAQTSVLVGGEELAAASFVRVQIAAHRGGYENDKADDAPENTVANIRNCQNKGYEIFETDVQRSKDGHFVMMHDPTIDRETTGQGPASDLNLADIQLLFKRFRDRSVSTHRVATLDEFLVEGKDRVVFKADLKPGVDKYFKEIIEIVVRHNAMDGIVFRVRYRDADRYADFRAAGVPFTRDMLMFMVSRKSQVDDIKKRFNPSIIQVNLDKDEPTKPETLELIRYATGQGLIVETHAEGTEDDWRRLVLAGVKMFHTNKPAKMKAFLQKTHPVTQ